MADVSRLTRDYIAGIPGNVGDVTDVAQGRIRDSYEGVYRQNRASAARRGVLDSGVHGANDAGTSDDLMRALAGSATDIANRGRDQAGQMLTNLSGMEATRAGLQQSQQQIGLQQRAADMAAQQQLFDQMRAISEMYQDRQPRSYYDDTDPTTVTTPNGSGRGAGPQGGFRPGEAPRNRQVAGQTPGSDSTRMRTGLG